MTVDPTPVATKADYVRVDMVRYLYVIWRRKYVPIVCGLVFLCLGYALSYTRPKLFLSSVKFMPPAAKSNGLLFSFGRSSGDEYRSMLTSETVGDDVVAHLHLMDVFKIQDPDVARAVLGGMSSFTIDPNNFITISVASKDPALAARIADEYYAALYRLEDRISADEAAHRLNFMSGPMEIERKRLSTAEDALRDAQQQTGLVLPQAQGALGVQQVASLRGRISDLEAQLATARVGATDENPRVVALRSQISNLQGQAAQLEGSSSQVNAPSRLPGLSLEVERRQRDVQYHEQTLLSLTKALETTQMSDSYAPTFALIDHARVAKRKFSPSRSTWALVGGFLGFVLGLIWILLRGAHQTWRHNTFVIEMIAFWNAASGKPATRNHGA